MEAIPVNIGEINLAFGFGRFTALPVVFSYSPAFLLAAVFSVWMS